jgi:serine/threonine-protein kinase
VLSWVPGETLDKHIANGPFEIEQALAVLEQLASGVAALHEKGIVHCDLTPRNIILSNDGHATIIDLGISRSIDGAIFLQTHERLGTPDYTSPEYIERGEVSEQLDVYSLGLIAYEMVTGGYPFKGAHNWQCLDQRRNVGMPSPLELRPDCPKALAVLIERATKRDARERFSSCAEMLAAIRAIRRSLSGGDGRTSRTARLMERLKDRFAKGAMPV